MRSLSCVLVREGAKDDWLLPVLLRRALVQMCAMHFPACGEVNPIRSLPAADHQWPVSMINEISAERGTFDVVLYHHDGAPPPKADPLIVRIRKAWQEQPEPLVAVVPIRESEAWLFADEQALIDVLSVRALPINPPRDVELLPTPKEEFRRLVHAVAGSRAIREHRIRAYYAELAERISIDELAKVPAFECWQKEMVSALERLGYQYG